jgi:zinc protease
MPLKKALVRLALAVLVPSLASAAGQAAAPRPEGPGFPMVQYALKNGLRVILAEDDSMPVVSVVVAYGAGPVREPSGKSGLAYLMENMMFQGSENVSAMQHVNYILRVGGEFNANTGFDKTYFYETVPSNQLALVLWLESDRMASLSINPANFERAKETLSAEHRQRRTTEPYLDSLFRFDRMVFPDYAYGHPVIGTEEDLRTITEEDVRGFYSTYYVPNNAVLCVSGALDVAKTRELIARYFETIPAGKEIAAPAPPNPEFPAGGEDVVIRDALVPSSVLHYAYRISRIQPAEHYGLKLLDILMFRGKSSRLYKRLIKKDRIAMYLSGGIEEKGGLAAFKIFVISNNPVTLDLCRKAIASEIIKLKTSLVSETELAKAKALLKLEYLGRFSTSLTKALFICETRLDGKDPGNMPEEFDRYLRITPISLIGTINRIFRPENALALEMEAK